MFVRVFGVPSPYAGTTGGDTGAVRGSARSVKILQSLLEQILDRSRRAESEVFGFLRLSHTPGGELAEPDVVLTVHADGRVELTNRIGRFQVRRESKGTLQRRQVARFGSLLEVAARARSQNPTAFNSPRGGTRFTVMATRSPISNAVINGRLDVVSNPHLSRLTQTRGGRRSGGSARAHPASRLICDCRALD